MPNWKKVAVSGSNVNFNQITASGDISSSANIISQHTTASGNISSSGTTYTKFLRIPNEGSGTDGGSIYFGESPAATNGFIWDDNSALTLGYDDTDVVSINDTRVAIMGYLGTTSHITASGNISASGDISASNVHLPGGGKVAFASDQYITGQNNNLTIDGDEFVRIKADDHVQFRDDSNTTWIAMDANAGHITASGNISSSGTITADALTATLAAGTDNSVVVLNSSNQLVTDEIDSGVWGGAGAVVTTTGEEVAPVATTATTATNVTVAANNSTDETTYLTFVDGSTGGQGIETDTALTYNPATNGVTLGQITASSDISASGTISGQAGLLIHSKSNATDGNAQGDVVYFGGGSSLTLGTVHHYNSSGNWEAADATDNTKSDGLLGVTLATAPSGGMLLRGMVTLDHDPGAIGDALFLTTTAGDVSATAPSGDGNILRIVGYCLDASNGQIWFNPDSTFVEVSA